jgi:hypothetical protein
MISSMKRTTLILSDRRLAEVKRVAADRGQTISAVVDEFLAEGVRRAKAPKGKLEPLPIFRMGEASVNIADRDRLYDVMDRA